MDRFKLTKQDRINQYKIIMYNVEGDLEYYTRPNIVRRLDKMGFFDAPASINHHGAYSGALFDHSLAVTGALLDYTDKLGLTWNIPTMREVLTLWVCSTICASAIIIKWWMENGSITRI